MINLVVLPWDQGELEGIVSVLVRGNKTLWERKRRMQEGTELVNHLAHLL